MQQCTFNFPETASFRLRPGNYYNIISPPKPVLIQTVTFSNQPGEAVPYYTVPHLFADRNSYPVLLRIVFPQVHHQIFIRLWFSLPIYILKISVLFQRFWKYHAFLFPFKEKKWQEKATKLRPMLIIFFFLLPFLLRELFFRLSCSSWPWIHELLIWIFFSVGTSFSFYRHLLLFNQKYLRCRIFIGTLFSMLKNIISIICINLL